MVLFTSPLLTACRSQGSCKRNHSSLRGAQLAVSVGEVVERMPRRVLFKARYTVHLQVVAPVATWKLERSETTQRAPRGKKCRIRMSLQLPFVPVPESSMYADTVPGLPCL